MSRLVVLSMAAPAWIPPGVEPLRWRAALAEDTVDLLATLAEVTAAVAAVPDDQGLAESILWPGMPVYRLPRLGIKDILAAAATDGYDQAAIIAPDAPDLPAMLIGKLLRPLSSRPLGVAPAVGGGLLGLAAQLPAPQWLPDVDLAAEADAVVAAAPRAGLVAVTPGWHRLSGPDGLSRLDPSLEGWEVTRALLSGN
jgi:hypothetical protein